MRGRTVNDTTPSAQYSAKNVANYFLKTYGRKHGISPVKLQKLVYLAHGWHLALYGEPLVADENAEAWQYGPVFPSLYHEFSEFGRGPITRLADDYEIADPQTGKVKLVVTPDIPKRDTQVRRLLDKIWEVYGTYAPWQLSAMTHKPDSPWDKTRKQSGNKNNADIDAEIIAAHYKNLIPTRAATHD